MEFERTAPQRGDDGREYGKPHQDAKENFTYAMSKLKPLLPKTAKGETPSGDGFINSMNVVFTDVDVRTNTIIDPKTVSFYWEVNGVKHVAVEDEAGRGEFAIGDALEELAQALRLAVVAAEVDIGQEDGVEHCGSFSRRRGEEFSSCNPDVCICHEGRMKSSG